MVLIIRYIILSLVLSLLMLLCPAAAHAALPAADAEACVLLCGDGSCLYEKNADERRLIASTTKLMTALVCVENAALEEPVLIEERYCGIEGSSMYLRAGETYTVRELLLGLLLASGNDAAVALSEHVAGGEEAFVRLMNERARELGLRNTHFENPHGLDAKAHYSSARDLAALMLCCMENPVLSELLSTKSAEIKGLTHVNHNRLLALCPGCIGGKTGYTAAAGRCLVSCCERGGLRLACATLSDPDDWNDHMRLYDWACACFELRDLSGEISFAVPVISGSRTTVRAVPPAGMTVLLPRNETVELRAELPRFVFAPVGAGEGAGTLSVLVGGRRLTELPLIYAEDAALADPVFYPFKEALKK